jgi:hypothetical protein
MPVELQQAGLLFIQRQQLCLMTDCTWHCLMGLGLYGQYGGKHLHAGTERMMALNACTLY